MALSKEDKSARAHAIVTDDVFLEALSLAKEYHTKTFLRHSSSEADVMEARQKILALTEVSNQLLKFIADAKLSK